MFDSVGRGGMVRGGRGGVSFKLLALFLLVAFGVVGLERLWTGPPPIAPVSVRMMPQEAAAAAEAVEAVGGLQPLPDEESP